MRMMIGIENRKTKANKPESNEKRIDPTMMIPASVKSLPKID